MNNMANIKTKLNSKKKKKTSKIQIKILKSKREKNITQSFRGKKCTLIYVFLIGDN